VRYRSLNAFLQSGLDNRRLSSIDHVDLAGIDVNADDRVPQFRETRSGHRTDITQSENRYIHRSFSNVGFIAINKISALGRSQKHFNRHPRPMINCSLQ
jgi:hypothetical protein